MFNILDVLDTMHYDVYTSLVQNFDTYTIHAYLICPKKKEVFLYLVKDQSLFCFLN